MGRGEPWRGFAWARDSPSVAAENARTSGGCKVPARAVVRDGRRAPRPRPRGKRNGDRRRSSARSRPRSASSSATFYPKIGSGFFLIATLRSSTISSKTPPYPFQPSRRTGRSRVLTLRHPCPSPDPCPAPLDRLHPIAGPEPIHIAPSDPGRALPRAEQTPPRGPVRSPPPRPTSRRRRRSVDLGRSIVSLPPPLPSPPETAPSSAPILRRPPPITARPPRSLDRRASAIHPPDPVKGLPGKINRSVDFMLGIGARTGLIYREAVRRLLQPAPPWRGTEK